MNKFFAMMLALVSLFSFTGCASSISSTSRSSVDMPGGRVVTLPDGTKAFAVNSLGSNGDLNGVIKKKTVVTETDAAGNVLKVITTETQEQVARNAYDAEHELEMRREQRKEAVGVANAIRPDYVSGYGGYYGGVTIGSGGRNYVHNSGGGTSSGSSGGATITTGSGGSNTTYTHQGGSNTSGGNSGGTTITTGSGGSNTVYRH